ncbi:MAG: endonuclease/exonuclease/phosphatase family protein [Polyangiaceae bacterium]
MVLLLSLAGCEPLSGDFDFERREAPVFARSEIVPPEQEAPGELRVMAYNIKFGAARADIWFDYWGDEVQIPYEEVSANLANIAALVREQDVDILIAEEVDVNSRRTGYHDMVREILEATDLNYAAYYQTWESRYVPSEGLGRIDMGNVIFSRYPITLAESIKQPDRTDQDGLTATFYLHRSIGRAIVDIGGAREIAVYAVHTEAYDQDGTKGRQIEQIHDEVSTETRPFLLGGDFNELPPNAVKLEGFADEAPLAEETGFVQPPYTPALMQPFYEELVPWVTLAEYGSTEEEQRKYYSHSVLGPDSLDVNGQPGFWTRTLDYLFVSQPGAWEPGSTDVLQEPGRQGTKLNPLFLSDHAPVVGTWILAGGAP